MREGRSPIEPQKVVHVVVIADDLLAVRRESEKIKRKGV